MRRLLAVLVPLTLAGCIGAAIHAGGLVADRGAAAAATEAAQGGDPAAQYRLGEAYCCAAFGSGGLLKNNQTATLCAAPPARATPRRSCGWPGSMPATASPGWP